MRSKITDLEYNMLNDYRHWYAWQSDVSKHERIVPIHKVLEVWEEQNADLYKLLGENLILTKEINFAKSDSELQDELYDIFDRYSSKSTRIDRKGWVFLDNYKEWTKTTYPIHHRMWSDVVLTEQQEYENEINSPIRSGLGDLIMYDTLSRNVFDGPDFSITLPNGKNYTVRSGCKPMKPLAKIADAFGLEGFEDFRICHSQVLNQKFIKGNLSLSIHPLDYWTMSDNHCGWDSCMSWQETGGYRQGTVEMMNSPCVVVAYLNASEEMSLGRNWKWNNKKWRCLYIVDKNVILSVKAYPYANDDLNTITLGWLKELAETNMGWTYWNDKSIEYSSAEYYVNPKYGEDYKFKIQFSSNKMYTDVGSTKHYMYLGEDLSSDTFGYDKSSIFSPIWHYNYSGPSQCVSCGAYDIELDTESCLVCSECEEVHYCSECGDRVWEDNEYWVEGYRLCECCYENLSRRCEDCEEDFFDENVNTVKFILPNTEEVVDYLNTVYKSHYIFENQLYKEFSLTLGEATLCNKCWNEFKEKYIAEGAEIHQYDSHYGNSFYGVPIDVVDKERLRWCCSSVQYDEEFNDYLALAQKYWRYNTAKVRKLD